MDSGVLFEKYTIQEIRDIERKTRQDIERKKEDLRQMVGERYRDLIEAADTIKEMKNSADNVQESVIKMQEMCHHLKQSFQSTTRGLSLRGKKENPKRKGKNEFYSIAVQIKLLLDMPEKIWLALEDCAYLQASRLFLLARHINTSLQSDTQQAAKISAYFPVLARQWAAIGHFRTTILQTCRDRLQEVDVSNQTAAECLCSILLLEDSSCREVFSEFLAARTNAVRQLFQVNQSSVSIKSQVSDVVKMIGMTIHQIYAVFFSEDSSSRTTAQVQNNLLMTLIQQITEEPAAGVFHQDGPLSISHKYLPKEILDFKPVHSASKPIPVSELRTSCQNWVTLCKSDIQSGLAKLLTFINSVKGLAAIRDEVWELLSMSEVMSSWDQVCSCLLDKPLELWPEFFCDLFLNRARELLQGHVDVAYSTTETQVARVLSDVSNMENTSYERNLSSYVWIESHQDIPANMAWIPVSSKTLSDGGTLVMKAKAFTPAVQSLCRILDHKLRLVLEDSQHYTQTTQEESSSAPFSLPYPPNLGNQKENREPFDKFADREILFNFIRDACSSCVDKLLDHLKQLLDEAQSQKNADTQTLDNRVIIDKVLLLGRFSSAISELCPYLMQCIIPVEKDSRSVKKTALKRSSPAVDDPKWSQLKNGLQNFSNDAYSVWSGHISQCLVDQFSTMVKDRSGQALLLSSTRWDEVCIEEETEEGEKVSSTIRLPMQASWYVQSLLYNLCEEINRIGGHALSRANLQHLTDILCNGLLSSYECLLSESQQNVLPMTQTLALQLLFDFKFLTSILNHKENSDINSPYKTNCQKVIDDLEAFVDPFDLDVFAPYIQGHLSQQVQKCQVLYGALTSLERHSTSSMMTSSMSRGRSGLQQEQHNILQLASNQNRLPLLPMSSQSSGRSLQASNTQVLKSKALSSSAASVAMQAPLSPPPVNEEEEKSFLGQMSTIWFSNVTNRK